MAAEKTEAPEPIGGARFGASTVYQIYVKSFRDSNGDGIGDIPGITEKLDYLSALGVDRLWLTPFFRSPLKDSGYDVADYCEVNPIFGTMADFDDLVAQAGRRGISIMLDMVFNHTSTQHAWFQRALAGDRHYQDYYIFRDGDAQTPPTNWRSKFGGSAWAFAPEIGRWYLHLYDSSQADLNWDNPRVRTELADVVVFWRRRGVLGFRFDVVNLISKPERFRDDSEGDGRRFYTDGPHVHEYLRELVATAGIADMITVGEMSSTTLRSCMRYTDPTEHELAMVFSFHHLKVDYRDGDKWSLMVPDIKRFRDLLRSWQLAMQSCGGWNALFMGNHDQPRPVSRFGDAVHHREVSAKMLAILYQLMRGTPFIYQGEELGMGDAGFTDIAQYRDVESLNWFRILRGRGQTEQEALTVLAARSRDNARTPMQWTSDAQAGFTDGIPWIEVPLHQEAICVAAETLEADSVWALFHELIALRKRMPVIARGDIAFLKVRSDRVVAYERTWGSDCVVVLCSFSDAGQPAVGAEAVAGLQRLAGSYADAPEICNGDVVLRPFEGVAFVGTRNAVKID